LHIGAVQTAFFSHVPFTHVSSSSHAGSQTGVLGSHVPFTHVSFSPQAGSQTGVFGSHVPFTHVSFSPQAGSQTGVFGSQVPSTHVSFSLHSGVHCLESSEHPITQSKLAKANKCFLFIYTPKIWPLKPKVESFYVLLMVFMMLLGRCGA
jgi:hypothetical protein